MLRNWTIAGTLCALLFTGVAAATIPSPTIAERMIAAADEGVEATVEVYRRLQEEQPSEFDFEPGAIIQSAVDAFSGGDRPTGITVMEAARRLFPEEPRVFSVLGQLYWYSEDRQRCIESFQTVLTLDPEHGTARRYLELLFFVPDDFVVPARHEVDGFVLRPFTPDLAELDYAAVMGSREHILGVFGPDDDWPRADLTLEDNRRAAEGHAKEFEQRVAFTYDVMNAEETEVIGCVYLIPIHADGFDVQVFFWVTEQANREGLDETMDTVLKAWLAESWPFEGVVFPGRDMDWKSYETVQR